MSEVRSVIVQVRDMPEEIVDTLKTRAEARGQSLSAYLRDLLTQEARMPLIEEVMARIAQDEPIDYSVEDIRAYIEEGRR
jgi:plasmid stability protein